MPRDRTGNRRFIPVPVDAELAETHILDNEEESRAYHTFPDRREGSKSSLILKKAQDQEVQPCPVYDKTSKRGTSSMA